MGVGVVQDGHGEKVQESQRVAHSSNILGFLKRVCGLTRPLETNAFSTRDFP
jgi:hypothetical protein